jgi:hypothetical protein
VRLLLFSEADMPGRSSRQPLLALTARSLRRNDSVRNRRDFCRVLGAGRMRTFDPKETSDSLDRCDAALPS